MGCDSNSQKPSEAKPTPPTTSTVPLRLWIVAQVSDPSLVERAWLTGSDQKLEIRVLSVEEYLAEKGCNCDVTLFPSRLLGEMIDRKWITKLPSVVAAANENVSQPPAAWTREVSYGGEVWAVPLGASIPLVVVSEPAAEAASKSSDWDELLKSLSIDSKPSTATKFDRATINRTALVDRFLVIAGSLTQRSPDYGILFDLQKMRPRLTEPEFVRAAEILISLSQQSSDPSGAIQSIAGDSAQAWTWLNAQTKPAISIVAPGLLDVAAAKLSGCKAVQVPTKSVGWNTGSGLIASLSANCRQSSRATELLNWLKQIETRQALSPLVVGIEPLSPVAGSDSSAWQARGVAMELAANSKIPSELRLPRAEVYRNALCDSLIAALAGEKPIADALSEASAAWQVITDSRGLESQRNDYEQSLGLTRK